MRKSMSTLLVTATGVAATMMLDGNAFVHFVSS
jgi:hypothetical protein